MHKTSPEANTTSLGMAKQRPEGNEASQGVRTQSADLNARFRHA
ncbi:hypothetical protein [Alicyclobacillus mengziensis]|nr:hypothetical protein [Alicyclobacillus mengziensis]